MKARDVIEAELSGRVTDASGWTYFDAADAILAALLAAPEATRLELARELVKAEGWRVVKVPGMAWLGEYGAGFNACRSAVLASEGGNGE